MLLLVGFKPTKGASSVIIESDSLPIRRAILLTSEGQKRAQIYNDFEGGDSLFRAAIEEDENYSPAYFYLAQLLSSEGISADTVLYYAQRAYQLDSLNKWYSDNYAQALAISGNFEESLRLYAKAIVRAPQDLTAYMMMAMLYRESKLPFSAIAILDSAELKVGVNSYASSLKRELLLSTGQRDRAITETIALTQIEPSDIENRLILAELYVATKQDSLARAEYQKALQIDPTSLVTLRSLSQFYAERNEFFSYLNTLRMIFDNESESLEQKIELFNRVTSDNKFYGTYYTSINELALSLWRQYSSTESIVELYTQHLIASGELDKALEIYKDRTKLRPASYEAFRSVIDIESYKQRVDSVELYATRAIELFPESYEFLLSQANLYSYTHRHDEAIESYQNILKRVPDNSLRSSIWGYIGDNYHQKSLLAKSPSKSRKMMKSAYKSYRNALEFNGKNAMVLNNYAYFLSLDREDLHYALDMSGRAIAIEKDNSTYLDTYAWILYELGRYEEAKSYIRQAMANDTTNSAELPFHYAEILVALGDNLIAEIYYDRALKAGYDTQIIEERKSKLK